MSVFTTNQVRQFYAFNSKGTVTESSALGTLEVSDVTKNKQCLYFKHKGQGGITRSDLIEIDNIIYAKASHADTMKYDLKSYIVELKDGNLVGGQDYLLKIVFRQYACASDEDTYTKYGMVHSRNNMSDSDFYKELGLSLVKNFSKEITPLVKFSLVKGEGDTATSIPLTTLTKAEELTETYTGIMIDELEQDWILGTKPFKGLNFNILPGLVTVDGEEVVWGTVTETESDSAVNNGKIMADLEFFCMGERGDIYRGVGYPNVVKTHYMVDPSQPYHTIDIHYAYVGDNESVQKSEKTITLTSTDITQINAIIGEINKYKSGLLTELE